MKVYQGLLKTKFYHHLNNRREDMRERMSLSEWWTECGAFVEILPRQVGKTTAIISLYNELKSGRIDPRFGKVTEFVKILCYSARVKENLIKRGISSDDVFVKQEEMVGLDYMNIHLFVDEYMFIDKKIVDFIFDQEWKSLNLISSLKRI